VFFWAKAKGNSTSDWHHRPTHRIIVEVKVYKGVYFITSVIPNRDRERSLNHYAKASREYVQAYC
jgi:hypothetical protein